MTPELPRADRTVARARTRTDVKRSGGASAANPSTANSIVTLMLVPVSRSGTGKTLSALMVSACSDNAARAVMTHRRSANTSSTSSGIR